MDLPQRPFVHFVGNKAKGRTSKRVFQETKARENFRKTNISYLLIRTRARAYQGGKKCLFFGNFRVLWFLETPVLRFALLPYPTIFSLFLLSLSTKELTI